MDSGYHFTMYNGETGEIIDQDRISFFFEDFVTDMILSGNIAPSEIKSVERRCIHKSADAPVIIDTPEGLKKLLEDVRDDLDLRKVMVNEAYEDVLEVIKDMES